MERFVLTDAQWARIEPHCLGKPTEAGRSGTHNRLFLEAVLWIARTGSPWRDLPALFGNWNTAWRCFGDWRKAYCHGQGTKGGTRSQAIGRSKGGMTTKILALTDALGNLMPFELLPGHRYDRIGVEPLLDGIDFGRLIAGKAFDSGAIITDLHARGAKIVISQHPWRTKALPLDRNLYAWRHLIENFFCKLKSSDASRCALTKPIKASLP